MEWLISNGAAVCCHLLWSLFHKSWASFMVKLYIDLRRRSDIERIIFLFFLCLQPPNVNHLQHKTVNQVCKGCSQKRSPQFQLEDIFSFITFSFSLFLLSGLQLCHCPHGVADHNGRSSSTAGWTIVNVSLFPAVLWPPHWALTKSEPLLSRQALTSWPLPVRCNMCLC